MPFGYLITTAPMAVLVLFAVAPRRPRQSSPVRLSFWLGFMVNELPFLAFYVSRLRPRSRSVRATSRTRSAGSGSGWPCSRAPGLSS
jgi:hypothetical protein